MTPVAVQGVATLVDALTTALAASGPGALSGIALVPNGDTFDW